MKRSMLTALAGGLITGSGTLGMDAALNTADAAPMTTTQRRNFELRLDGAALTCCYDSGVLVDEFAFEGFDPIRGRLNTATLDINLAGLLPDSSSLTCCYDFTDVVSFSGTLLGEDISAALVRDLADGSASLQLDPRLFGPDPVAIGFGFQLVFDAGTALADPNASPGGSMALSYTFTPPVPEPATLALGAAGLFTAFAAGARRRRRDAGS